MRYRQRWAIVACCLLPLGAWADPGWAPTDPTVEGWTLPDLELDDSARRIQRAGKERAEPAVSFPERSWPSAPGPSWPTAGGVQLSVDPGKSFASTVFEVYLEGFAADGERRPPNLQLVSDQGGSAWVQRVVLVGPGRWQFHGRDLQEASSSPLWERAQDVRVLIWWPAAATVPGPERPARLLLSPAVPWTGLKTQP